MGWYCDNCGYVNGTMDTYCCNCHKEHEDQADRLVSPEGLITLCAACTSGLMNLNLSNSILDRKSLSNHDVQEAAKKCFMCKKLWDQVDPVLRQNLHQQNSELGVEYENVRLKDYDGRYLVIKYNKLGHHNLSFCRYIFSAISNNLKAMRDLDPIKAPLVATPFPWNTISNWLQNCDLHEKCHIPTKRYIPTRLLDLTPPLRAPGILARLFDSTEISGDVRYATLGHRWGDRAMIMLTGHNLTKFNQEGIQMHIMPKSFQDAITVTLKLGIRYLWIDSLCIRQDSLDEWHHEAALMAQVYSNAYINISATAASDSSGGLNVCREITKLEPKHLFVVLGANHTIYQLESKSLWAEEVLNAPLNYRAWVVQERLLSRRNLQFGSNQLFWECDTISACENYPRGMPEGVLASNIKQKLSNLLRGSIETIQPLEACRYWGSIVEMYSRGYLTVQTDKLIAISGLATLVHQAIGGQYLAGMWERFLPQQLLWVSTQFRMITTEYTAPSWSWASSSTVVAVSQRPAATDNVLITVLDACVDLVSSDNIFGQVKAGHIIVKCSLATARPEDELGGGRHLRMNSNGGCDYELNERFDRPWPSFQTEDPESWILLPILHTNQDIDGEIREHVHGLILEPVDIESRVFRRSGVWALRFVGTVERIRDACACFDEGALASKLKGSKSGKLGCEYKLKII